MPEAVPKIEGHAAFYTHLKNGRVDKARMIGLENDRFFEKILIGRKYWEAPIITSRICGICPTIHNITATKAIEDACGIIPSEQTKKMRKIMLCGQMIQSHSLHLYLLVLPDYVGVSSSFELQKKHPELFNHAIVLKKYADKLIEFLGGRAVHPIANVPGGFKSFPMKEELGELLKLSEQAESSAKQTISLFSDFAYPEIGREMIYSGLRDKDEYAFYEGEIWTSNGEVFAPKEYGSYLQEELRPYTKAKFATLKGKEIMVGAMARLNLNSDHLMPSARESMNGFLQGKKFDNPFWNIMAQAIENYHFVLFSIKLLEELLSKGIKKEHLYPTTKFGIGVSACEAPRGTLFHYYEVDKEGDIINCDIITPTVQNLPSMESDMEKLAPNLKDKKNEERNRFIETLIRAYDPCITCATH